MKFAFYIAKNGDWLDKLIGKWTGGPFSHVEIVFSDGECFSSSWRDNGTRFKKINVTSDNWELCEFVESSEADIREWCQSQIGLKYDLLGVFGIPFKLSLNRKNSWYCSEICAEIARRFAKYDLPKNLSPNYLYKLLSSLK